MFLMLVTIEEKLILRNCYYVQLGYASEDSSFFNPHNTSALALRSKFAVLALDGRKY